VIHSLVSKQSNVKPKEKSTHGYTHNNARRVSAHRLVTLTRAKYTTPTPHHMI
jgi:hypothetical protein